VRYKGKYRNLVAASNVADYPERIRDIAKTTSSDDFEFTTFKGKRAGLLYRPIETLLTESGLRLSSSDSRCSTYCFRHTYATFWLSEGVDVYFLANQMGTSGPARMGNHLRCAPSRCRSRPRERGHRR
jgi:integrase